MFALIKLSTSKVATSAREMFLDNLNVSYSEMKS